MILGGFGAPLFLLLAGVSVSLSAASKLGRTGDRRRAAVAVMRRGLEVFLLAFVFRIQAWILGWASRGHAAAGGHPQHHGSGDRRLRGHLGRMSAPLAGAWLPSLAQRWQRLSSRRSPGRRPASPAIPDPIEAYLRPTGSMTSFAIMPWAALRLRRRSARRPARRGPTPAMTRSSEARLNLGFAIAGTVLAAGSYAAASLPPLYSGSSFWTTSPCVLLPTARECWPRPSAWPTGGNSGLPTARLEPGPPARPDLAVHLLDPRRDGLRADFAADPPRLDTALGGRGPGAVHGLHAGLLAGKDRIAGWWARRRPAVRTAGTS